MSDAHLALIPDEGPEPSADDAVVQALDDGPEPEAVIADMLKARRRDAMAAGEYQPPPPKVSVEDLPKAWGPEHVETFPGDRDLTPQGQGEWRPRRATAQARRAAPYRPCPTCHDTGSIYVEVPYEGLPGQTHRVPVDCRCKQLDHRINLFNQAGLPPENHGDTLSGLTLEGTAVGPHFAELRAWFSSLSSLAVRGAEPTHGLLLLGKTGTGKTTVAAAAVRWATLGLGLTARWTTVGALKRELIAAKDSHSATNQLTALYVDCDLLVVDEISEQDTADGWWGRITGDLLQPRLQARRTTIFTSNHTTPGEWVKVAGDRMASRAFAACKPIVFRGPDHRMSAWGAWGE